MRVSRLTLIAILLVLVGIGAMIATATGMWWSWSNFMASGVGITVPDSVEIDLVDSGTETVVWRELAGTHITTNRPEIEPPTDLVIEVIDRQTGEAIPTERQDWYVRQRLMPGFDRSRRAICSFPTPAHGQITLTVTGSFPHDQVFRVAPSIQEFAPVLMASFQFGIIGGFLVMLLGIAGLITSALRSEKAPLRLDDQPLA